MAASAASSARSIPAASAGAACHAEGVELSTVLERLRAAGEAPFQIGRVEAGSGRVRWA